jgi:hypothetical protein
MTGINHAPYQELKVIDLIRLLITKCLIIVCTACVLPNKRVQKMSDIR